MAREQRRAVIQQIEALRESRVVCCVTSDRVNAAGMIAKDFIPILYTHLRKFDAAEKVDLFLFTTGGDTLAAFGISRLLREFGKDRVGVLIPEKCHSAGTLLALGADQIFMTPAATLSPIDPSVVTQMNPKPQGVPPGTPNPPFPVSVENIAGYKDLAYEEWQLSTSGKTNAFEILAREVHPLVLGQAYRTRQQIERLARVLLKSRKAGGASVTKIIDQLTRKLGSHDYLISRTEAGEMLGSQILRDDPGQALERAVWDLYEDFREEMELGRIYDPVARYQQALTQGGQVPVTIKNRVVAIETTDGSDVWESDLRVGPALAVANLPIPVPSPGIQQVVLYNGWRHYE